MMKERGLLIKYFSEILLIFGLVIVQTESGPNNLHVNDGATTAEIIAGDIFFEILDPIELEYTYRIRPAKNFGAPFNESFYIKHVPLVPMQPKHGCTPPENLDDIEGNVALIERGQCSFKAKTKIAEKAGAQAVIITDVSKPTEEYFIEMIDDESSDDVNIPAAFLMGKNGIMITRTLERLKRNYAIINLPVNLTFTPIHAMNQPPWLGW